MYITSYNTNASDLDPAAAAAAIAFVLIFGLAVYAVTAIFLGKLFKKAGVPFWKAWVPIYNQVKFFQIGGQNPLILWFLLLPIIGWVIYYVFCCIAAYNIDKKLGKSDAFVLLYIFFGIVWLGINAFDKSKWNDSLGTASLVPEKAPAKTKD
jgi:hypothetical protein